MLMSMVFYYYYCYCCYHSYKNKKYMGICHKTTSNLLNKFLVYMIYVIDDANHNIVTNYFVLLGLKGCICHCVKLQIHAFIAKEPTYF